MINNLKLDLIHRGFQTEYDQCERPLMDLIFNLKKSFGNHHYGLWEYRVFESDGKRYEKVFTDIKPETKFLIPVGNDYSTMVDSSNDN